MNLQGSLRAPFLSGPKRTPTVAAATERDGMMRVEEGAWKGLVIILSRNATYRPTRAVATQHIVIHTTNIPPPHRCVPTRVRPGPYVVPFTPARGILLLTGGVFSTHPPSTQNMIQGIPPPSSPVLLFFTTPPLFIHPPHPPALFHMPGPAYLHFFSPTPRFFTIASPPLPPHPRGLLFFLNKNIEN